MVAIKTPFRRRQSSYADMSTLYDELELESLVPSDDTPGSPGKQKLARAAQEPQCFLIRLVLRHWRLLTCIVLGVLFALFWPLAAAFKDRILGHFWLQDWAKHYGKGFLKPVILRHPAAKVEDFMDHSKKSIFHQWPNITVKVLTSSWYPGRAKEADELCVKVSKHWKCNCTQHTAPNARDPNNTVRWDLVKPGYNGRPLCLRDATAVVSCCDWRFRFWRLLAPLGKGPAACGQGHLEIVEDWLRTNPGEKDYLAVLEDDAIPRLENGRKLIQALSLVESGFDVLNMGPCAWHGKTWKDTSWTRKNEMVLERVPIWGDFQGTVSLLWTVKGARKFLDAAPFVVPPDIQIDQMIRCGKMKAYITCPNVLFAHNNKAISLANPQPNDAVSLAKRWQQLNPKKAVKRYRLLDNLKANLSSPAPPSRSKRAHSHSTTARPPPHTQGKVGIKRLNETSVDAIT